MHAAQAQIKLIEPTSELKTAFLSMLDEHWRVGEAYYNHALAHKDFGRTFNNWLKRLKVFISHQASSQ